MSKFGVFDVKLIFNTDIHNYYFPFLLLHYSFRLKYYLYIQRFPHHDTGVVIQRKNYIKVVDTQCRDAILRVHRA